MEKNSTKISLITAICIVLIILLIIALIFVYITSNKKIKDLESKTATLEDRIILQQENIESSRNEIVEPTTVKEETIEIKETEGNIKLLTSDEIDKILKPNEATFCIEDIQKSGDDYIIIAYMLETTPRVLTDSEYNSLLNGGEIEFRHQKWVLSSNDEYSLSINSGEGFLMVSKDTKIVLNGAGAVAKLCDYSDQKIAFKVSKDILIGAMFSEFKYDANGKIHKYSENYEEVIDDSENMSFERLLEVSKGCSGYHDECAAYVRNGVVDAIKINYA